MKNNKTIKALEIGFKEKVTGLVTLVLLWLTANPVSLAAQTVTIDPVKDMVLLLASSVVIIMTVIFAIKEWTRSIVKAALIMVGGSLLFWFTKNPEQTLNAMGSIFSKVFGG